MKTVYTCFCTDVIHGGHKNIIAKAKEYGDVIVGVLSDKAMILEVIESKYMIYDAKGDYQK